MLSCFLLSEDVIGMIDPNDNLFLRIRNLYPICNFGAIIKAQRQCFRCRYLESQVGRDVWLGLLDGWEERNPSIWKNLEFDGCKVQLYRPLENSPV